jgi:hypothetical protein
MVLGRFRALFLYEVNLLIQELLLQLGPKLAEAKRGFPVEQKASTFDFEACKRRHILSNEWRPPVRSYLCLVVALPLRSFFLKINKLYFM